MIAAGVILVAWLLHPAIEALVWEIRIRRNVKVEFTHPQCVSTNKGLSEARCQCELVFDGITNPSEIYLEGYDLYYTYDAGRRTFHLHGAGLVLSANNRAEITSTGVFVNSTELPADNPSAFHVLIEKDGTLQSSRRDIAW